MSIMKAQAFGRTSKGEQIRFNTTVSSAGWRSPSFEVFVRAYVFPEGGGVREKTATVLFGHLEPIKNEAEAITKARALAAAAVEG